MNVWPIAPGLGLADDEASILRVALVIARRERKLVILVIDFADLPKPGFRPGNQP